MTTEAFPLDAPPRAFAGHWRDAAARRADAAVHLAGAAAALGAVAAALPRMLAEAGLSWPLAAYLVALAALFPASALFQHGPEGWRAITIKIDHAAIHLKIAASFGALAAAGGGGPGWLWPLAALGALARALGPARMRGPGLAIHLLILAGGCAALGPALPALAPATLRLAGLGALLYLAGLPFHLSAGPRFHQAIWHAAVLAGSGAVCAAILTEPGA